MNLLDHEAAVEMGICVYTYFIYDVFIQEEACDLVTSLYHFKVV